MQYGIVAQAVSLGGFIAIWKVIIFAVLFGCWAWIGQWMDKDTIAVNTRREFWNTIYLMTGTLIVILWFFLPVPFIVSLLMFLILWAMLVTVYILHRNARVPKNQQILTLDHLKWLFSLEERQRKKLDPRLVFITVNGNEVPMPYKQDKEYPGYVVAEEVLHEIWLKRVSHAEIIPKGEVYEIRYVIDGITSVAGERAWDDMVAGISYLKAVAGLDLEDHRKPQAGSFFTIRTGDNNTGWRIHTSGSTRGEQVVLDRIEEYKSLKIEDLGLHPDQLEKIKEALNLEQGIFLVTGPKGSGVSSTIYSFVRFHDAFIKNIYTLEKDFLYELDNITQNKLETGPEAKTASQQLRSSLLADPDVMMVGFCSEPQMAKVATKAARSGKKIYIAMPAQSTFHALQEWMKWVGDPAKVAESLVAITNQRLIRILCDECREAYTPDANMVKKLNLPADKIKQFYRPPTEIEYDKRGNPILCPKCQGTGYLGRTAVFETLFISDSLRKLIAKDAPIQAIRTQCRKERMLFMQEQSLRKVIDGTTSIQEVLRVSR